MFLATHGVLRKESAYTPPAFTDIYSFEYDGVSDYIDCGDNNNLSFGNGSTDSPFSVSVWVKMDDNSKFRALSKWGAANTEYIVGTSNAGTLQFVLYQSSSIYIGVNGLTTMPINTWNHIVCTCDGSSSANVISIF